MGKIFEITPVFMYYLPAYEDLEEGILYISKEYGITKHLCACGCKELTVLPFDNVIECKDHGWKLIIDGDLVTMKPSVGNFSGEIPYHAHYYITKNKIVWC